MSFLVILVIQAAITLAAYLLTPKPRNPRPDIAGVKPPSTTIGQPIPVVFGTMKLPPMVAWWGNSRAQQYSSANGNTYNYGFDFMGVLCMGPVDAILDYTVNDHSLVQYTQQRHYVNAWGDPVTNTPILVQYYTNPSGPNATFPLRFGTFPAGGANMVIDAPKLLGGPLSAGGLSQVWMDFFLGGPGQAVSATMARLIGNVLASSPTGTPVPQPLYTSLCYMVSYQDQNPDNFKNSGYYGTSPIPPTFAAVIQRCPKTLSTALGHPEYATFSTYDANPVEALYSALTSQEFAAGLKPLLQIPSSGIDVTSFETACATVYTEALIGSNPGPPIARSYLSNNVNKGDGTFSNIAGALGAPTEIITVTFTGATTFTVTGSVSGPIGTGTTGTPFTSAVISFTITAGIIAFIASDYFQFFVTQIASAGISDAIGASDATAAEEWFRGILTAIDGVMFTHPETSLLTLKLVRSDYTLADQPLVDESVYDDSLKYVEGSWPQTFNEVSVRYRNRGVDYTAPVTAAGDAWAMAQGVATVQNIAALQANGGIPQLAEPLDLPMLTNGLSAAVCAARALRTVSVPRARASWLQNRTAHAFTPGMVVQLASRRFGITQKAMRITSADYGTLENGKIRIEAVEDSFVTRPPIFPIDPGSPISTGVGGGGLVTATGATITLAITPTPVTIQVGQSVTFTVVATSGGTPVTDSFAFTTADATIASVSGSGTATGVAVGTTTIAVYDPFGNRATAVVTVVAAASPVLDHLTITPLSATVAPAATQTYVVAGVDQFGAPYAVTPVFASSLTGVGTINSSTGVATGVATGETTITATAGGLSVTATLTVAVVVIPPPPGAIAVIPPATYLTATNTALAGGGSGLAAVTVRARFLVDQLLTPVVGVAVDYAVYAINDGSGISNSSCWLDNFIEVDNTGTVTFITSGFGPRFTVAQSALPPAGSELILVTAYNEATSAVGVELVNDAGTVYGGNANTVAMSGNTPAAATTVWIGRSVVGPGFSAGLAVDGFEIVTALMATPNAVPSLADTGVIQLTTFDASDLTALVGSAFTTAFISGSAPVTFTPGGIWGTAASGSPVLSGLTINPATTVVAIGATVTELASGIDQFGAAIADSNPITYSSADGTIATVGSSSGIVTGVANGVVAITATDGTYSATALVTVGTPVIVSPSANPLGSSVNINYEGKPNYEAVWTVWGPGATVMEEVCWNLKYFAATASSASTPVFSYGSLDTQIARATSYGYRMKAYVFQLNAPTSSPAYIDSLINTQADAKAYITAIAAGYVRYKSNLVEVNVGNEAAYSPAWLPNRFRTVWGGTADDPTTGVIAYILNAFAAALPGVDLSLNFSHFHTGTALRAFIVSYLTALKATGSPGALALKRIGSEMHVTATDFTSGLLASQLPGLTATAGQLAALGLVLDFTEFDIIDDTLERASHAVPGPEFPADYPTRDAVSAKIINLYGPAFLSWPNHGRWMWWQYDSEWSWLNNPPNTGTPFNRTDGQRVRADLLNSGVPSAAASAFFALFPTLTGLGPPPGPPPADGLPPEMPAGMTLLCNSGTIVAGNGWNITGSPSAGGTVSLGGTVNPQWSFNSGGTGFIGLASAAKNPDGSTNTDVKASGVRYWFPAGQVNDPAVDMYFLHSPQGTGTYFISWYEQWNPMSWAALATALHASDSKAFAPKNNVGDDLTIMSFLAYSPNPVIGLDFQGSTDGKAIPDVNGVGGAGTIPVTSAFYLPVPGTKVRQSILIKSNGTAGTSTVSFYINGVLCGTCTDVTTATAWTSTHAYVSRSVYGGTQTTATYVDRDQFVVGVS